MPKQENDVREFLEGLPADGLRRLIDEPVFTGTVLKHAAESPKMTQTFDGILDAEFQALTAPEQARITRLAKRVRSAIEA